MAVGLELLFEGLVVDQPANDCRLIKIEKRAPAKHYALKRNE